MMIRKLSIPLILILFLPSFVSALTLELGSPGTIEDTYLDLRYENYHTLPNLNVYTWPANTIANSILIKWDLSSIPQNTLINDAKLYLHLITPEAGGWDSLYDVSVHRIINHNPDISLADGETYDGTNEWTANDCCYNNWPLAQGDITAAEDTQSLDKTYEYKEWTVTQMVTYWLNNPSENYGLLLSSDPVATSDSNRHFASSENPAIDQRPKLVITYAIVQAHEADTDENGCVETNEMVAYMKRWKISSQDVTMVELMEAIGLWIAGTGCITCTSHDYSQCYNGDRYWYDSCNNREDLRENCAYGCSDDVCTTCTSHDYSVCYNNDRYWYDSCDNREDMRESCDYGCSGDTCTPEPTCSGTDTSCGTYPDCENCNSQDDCSGTDYRDYSCSGTSCTYSSDDCSDCSCSCGGYNTFESTSNGNCGDGRDNDCDGDTDTADSGCQGGSDSCQTSTCVDFADEDGTVDLIYGVNEDNDWAYLVGNPINQQRHREVGTRSVRVWLSAQSYREDVSENPICTDCSTFPFDGSSYDFTNVDMFVDAALKASIGDNPPLYIAFAHGDNCGGTDYDFDSGCEGHNEPAPSDPDEFADYVVTVIDRYIDKCANDPNFGGGKPCDPVDDWYYEILNEPNSISQSVYANIVNTVHQALIDANIGDLKLAAFKDADAISAADFTIDHLYCDNRGCGGSDTNRMNGAGYIYHDSVDDVYKEVINSEYAHTFMPGRCQRRFEGSWTAASLINQIKADTHMEHFYYGTNSYSSGVPPESAGNIYGMWSRNGDGWPVYDMKKQFVISHPSYIAGYNPASIRYNDNFHGNGFYVLASQRADDGRRFITLVNKNSGSQSLNLEIVNAGSGSGTESLSFSGFETKFLELQGSNWVMVESITP